MLLTGPSDPPPTAIIPHRMKPHVAPPEPLREATEVVPTVAPVAPAATPPEVSIHKTVGPHPASAGASPPCLPLGYCPALRGTASFPGAGHPREGQQASLLGDKYLLLEALEGSSLHRCLHIQTQEELVCKVVSREAGGQSLLAAHYRVDGHPRINPIQEVVVGQKHIYLVFPPCHGDMHCYVRTRRRLREPNARHLFRQIVAAVHEAHIKGIVLRDLKLRKFVFTDESRTEVKLESLEDAVVLEDYADDLLSDKHGCPAYVSPEILRTNTRYSGRAADMWGLGVMLYTMLVGRYPFHGAEHSGLFAKIRRGHFSLPDSLSSRAKCLIRCLLRKEPGERISTEDVLVHPWLVGSHRERGGGSRRSPEASGDQAVPIFCPSKGENEHQQLLSSNGNGPLFLSSTSPGLSEAALARPLPPSEPPRPNSR